MRGNFRRLLPILVTFAVLLGSAGEGWSADFNKGFTAYQRGDYATALREWKPLTEQGYAPAQYNLGVMYEKGQGVIQDNTYAHMWWNFAASKGDKEARKKET